jgi:hypothetical protein
VTDDSNNGQAIKCDQSQMLKAMSMGEIAEITQSAKICEDDSHGMRNSPVESTHISRNAQNYSIDSHDMQNSSDDSFANNLRHGNDSQGMRNSPVESIANISRSAQKLRQ